MNGFRFFEVRPPGGGLRVFHLPMDIDSQFVGPRDRFIDEYRPHYSPCPNPGPGDEFVSRPKDLLMDPAEMRGPGYMWRDNRLGVYPMDWARLAIRGEQQLRFDDMCVCTASDRTRANTSTG